VTTYLLDANVLVALTIKEHEHHERATAWMAGIDRFAVCPIVEGALVRFFVRLGESAATAVAVLTAVRALPSAEFWPDDLSYTQADLSHVVGHRQVTDAYLLDLARHHRGASLATFDEGLTMVDPSRVVMVPELAG
jgi:toxin-antitoxin system PIN domain toxin